MSRLLAVFLLLASCLSAAEPSGGHGLVRLYLDPQQTFLDTDYLRKELTWVDWVRQREESEVHLIVTEQRNGGGGSHYTLRFLGLGVFQGLEDELGYSVPPATAPDAVRQGLAAQIALGLARYVARGPEAGRLALTLKEGVQAVPKPAGGKDPWNGWVFRIGGSASLNGETQTASSFTSVNLGASRITEDRLLRVSMGGNWNQSRYTLSDGEYRSSSESYSTSGTYAAGISQHWTWGLMGRAGRSYVNNIDGTFRVAPALEYNVWKYSEASQKQLAFLYQVGLGRSRYREETIYGKQRETLLDNSLDISLDLNQPWGTISAVLNGSAYLHDWSKHSLGFFGAVQVRLAKGLSLNFFGNVERVRDQLSLPRQGATDDEILLRLKVLETSYRYWASIGISYSFGSIFNNAVNSRFRSVGGRSFSMSF